MIMIMPRDHEDEARTRDHGGGALVLGEERSSLGVSANPHALLGVARI